MPTTLRTLTAFVSSPSDVPEERNIAKDVINRIDSTFRKMFGTSIEVIRWDDLSPLTQRSSKYSLQDEIDDMVKKCDIFILILYKRYGTVQNGYNIPNTEREINIVLERIDRDERVMLLTYFRKLQGNDDPGGQEKGVVELRRRLDENNIWHFEYDDTVEFRENLTHDIYQTVLKFIWETTKYKALKCFWQFGEPERLASTRVAIIYPPIDRSYTRQLNPDLHWHNRLAPNIVFEDYQALQKIQKGFTLIGFRDYRIHTTYTIPRDINNINRIWLCLPRSRRALRQLQIYQTEGRANFDITPRTEKKHAQIKWKNAVSGMQFFSISSPLASYLNFQRKGDLCGGEWHADMGRIVSKDYAILARFVDRREHVETKAGSKIYDYFVAGIRGLGTWGAAWFFDRKSRVFLDFEPHVDIQLLLEVTYVDERIFDVKVVSDKPSIYFQNQNRKSTILRAINEFTLRM